MTNKTLTAVILILVVLFVGFVLFMRGANRASEAPKTTNTESYTKKEESMSEEKPVATTPEKTTEGQVAGNSQDTSCKRNFDSEKLKNEKVSISGREVEMQVKGFGTIKLSFYEKDAPKTVENFLRLANSGYFDCLTFHRVAKGFVIQGGDPTGTGAGGESAFGGEFADEINPNSALYKTGYVKGVLAMANRGANTNTSQFFIMLGDVPLPPSYTIFGKVSTGLDVVDKIGQVDIIPQMGPTDGKPKEAVVMTSVKITK